MPSNRYGVLVGIQRHTCRTWQPVAYFIRKFFSAYQTIGTSSSIWVSIPHHRFEFVPDEEGHKLPTIQAAQNEAVRSLGDLVPDAACSTGFNVLSDALCYE